MVGRDAGERLGSDQQDTVGHERAAIIVNGLPGSGGGWDKAVARDKLALPAALASCPALGDLNERLCCRLHLHTQQPGQGRRRVCAVSSVCAAFKATLL